MSDLISSLIPQLSTTLLYLQVIYAALYGLLLIPFGTVFPKLKVRPTNMSGKTVIVTGGNSGVGFEISKQLAEMGATVYLACRNKEKAQTAVEAISRAVPNASVHLLELDTASFASVRSFAADWEHQKRNIDVLVHNAGIPSPPKDQPFTGDGFESVYQVNFLSSFLLTHLLERHLSRTARVILTTSHGAYSGVIGSQFSLDSRQQLIELGFHTAVPGHAVGLYSNSKLMQIVFARALQRRFRADTKSARRSAYAFHPGFVKTAIFAANTMGPTNWMTTPLYKFLSTFIVLALPSEQGAKDGVFLATSTGKDVTETGAGGFWYRLTRWISPADLFSDEKVDRLWIRWCADAGIEWL